jgi:carboxypeptidase Taq
MTDYAALYDNLCRHCRETALLSSVESLLGWDERTVMPPAAGEYRAEQMTLLAGMIHQRETDPQVGEWLAALADSPLAADPTGDTAVVLRETKRDYDKKTRLPQKLVEEITRTSVLGQQTWVEARKNNDFRAFEPLLSRMVSLKREEADALGYVECRYDALLDSYEPEARTSQVAQVLAALRDQLVPLVAAISDSRRAPDLTILARQFPTTAQAEFGRGMAAAFGFDFNRGRLDVTAHPFCSGMGPHDCRITTRYNEQHFNEAFFGILHEAGHGLYEQGLPPAQFGLPTGTYVSLGIHESQSRMWENLVGRSRSFWDYAYPLARQAFPAALSDVRLDDFYFAINDVRPSLIRVEADEVTYNLHILIRFELEQALINNGLAVADLPAAWNEKYRQYLGLEPQSDADGVLQDIHWSAGLLGYFATYALGNLYASQFFEQADRDCGGLAAQFARGEFQPLREWLAAKIHRQGRRYTAAKLVEQVTGQPLSHDALIRHLSSKFKPLYGLAS